jgi:hypothetical protein
VRLSRLLDRGPLSRCVTGPDVIRAVTGVRVVFAWPHAEVAVMHIGRLSGQSGEVPPSLSAMASVTDARWVVR